MKAASTWPVNSAGEIVVQAGTGSSTIVGYMSNDQVAVDDSTGAVVMKLPTSGTPRTVTASTTATKTDVNGLITYNSASAGTITITNDATGGWTSNEFIAAYQAGAGTITFAAGSGVTIRSPAGVAGAVQYSTIAIQRVGANEWALV